MAGAPPKGRPTVPSRGAPFAVLALAIAAGLLPGCYAAQIATLHSGLDSLRTVVDTLSVRDSVTYAVLVETRRELAQERELLLSTRATTGTTQQQMSDQMERIQTRLEQSIQRFSEAAQHPPPVTEGPGPDQLYRQASTDLTQGRYALALQGFRDYQRRFPTSEQGDKVQYGIGECFFAQARFDSAAVEYARVDAGWPQSDRVPAALYKLALSQENLGQGDTSKATLQSLVKRYPQSGEAQLARDRLGSTKRR